MKTVELSPEQADALRDINDRAARAQAEPQKFDNEKNMLELIPPEFLQWTAVGLTYGAKKYAPGNWATGAGFDHSRLYGALQRHLNAYWGGEDIDPESGNHHLAHAGCMLAFLIAHVARGFGHDDRVDIGVSERELP